jgi:hypothetical protein
MPSGRPASVRTRQLQRRISDADAAILAHAGDGDISAGFKYLLTLYGELYAAGVIRSPAYEINNILERLGSDPN